MALRAIVGRHGEKRALRVVAGGLWREESGLLRVAIGCTGGAAVSARIREPLTLLTLASASAPVPDSVRHPAPGTRHPARGREAPAPALDGAPRERGGRARAKYRVQMWIGGLLQWGRLSIEAEGALS